MIKEIKNKNEWESFLINCKDKTFLQSWNWGKFNEELGKKIWRLGIYENDELLAICLVVKIKARRGIYLLIEHGPVLRYKEQDKNYEIMKDLLEYLKILAKKETANFIRICAILESNKENIQLFKDLGFRQAPIHEHPEVSWVLDIDKSEDELLMNMRKTTRYLIRQGLKNSDIQIIKSKDIKDIDVFNKLYLKTGKRGGFVPFSFNFLKNEFKIFSEDDEILLLLGKYKKEVVAGAMIIFWQNSAFYHQGASLRKYSKMPVSYLLQWEAIKEARNRGLKHYSFWGIAPKDKPNHPWKGLTLFKKGFGGRQEEYVEAQDFIISQKYWFSYIIERFRKIKRGF
jgi:lipid II:glycine glycyltransferase (peptidoglycan interpeptide bridge formation enzyme)